MDQAIVLIKIIFEPDGTFPKGRPDPLIPENRAETIALVKENGADLAVAWDADGDRCFFADENGDFLEGGQLTAFLATQLLKDNPGDKILYDPRHIWAVEETVAAAGGTPLITKTGHAFIKNRMKQEDALFAGETSGHYFFRDFFYADNGIVPFLIILNVLAANPGVSLSQLAAPLRAKYFVVDQVNFTVSDVNMVLEKIEAKYSDGTIDRTDGLSINYPDWRFNLRGSNTEPLIRLNVEGRSQKICEDKLAELTAAIKEIG